MKNKLTWIDNGKSTSRIVKHGGTTCVKVEIDHSTICDMCERFWLDAGVTLYLIPVFIQGCQNTRFTRETNIKMYHPGNGHTWLGLLLAWTDDMLVKINEFQFQFWFQATFSVIFSVIRDLDILTFAMNCQTNHAPYVDLVQNHHHQCIFIRFTMSKIIRRRHNKNDYCHEYVWSWQLVLMKNMLSPAGIKINAALIEDLFNE